MHIPSESLSRELVAFAHQCKVRPLLLSVGDELDGIRGNAIDGDLPPTEALRRILAHTGWTFTFTKPDEVSIKPDRRPVPLGLAELPAPPMRSGNDPIFGPPDRPMPLIDLTPAPLAQVLVTGSLIRGVDAITSPLITLVEGQIPDTGYAGAQSMINNALPITSNNTPREDYTGVVGNYGFGLGINLRGLGVGATLTLVDGRRQPRAGLYGAFVDVSTVPSAAIDRIEVIPDGASALYGSDAIAGVINIILRHDLVGAETAARYALSQGGGNEALASQVLGSKWEGGHGMFLYEYSDRTSIPIASRPYAANPDRRAQGGDDFRSINANPGNILDPATYLPAFAIPNAQDGQTLSVDQLIPGQVNRQNQLLGRDLYPQHTTHSFYWTAEQEVSTDIVLFMDGRVDRRDVRAEGEAPGVTLTVPASNAFFAAVDPFGGQYPSLPVAYSFYNDLGNPYWSGRNITATASIGLKVDFAKEWQSTFTLSDGVENMNVNIANWYNPTALDTALADSNKATAFNPFAAGSNTPLATLNQIRAVQGEEAWSRVPEFNVVADGPLFSRTSTSANLALGMDLRQESLKQHQALTDYLDVRSAYQREVGSVFGELALKLPEHLEVSLAGRYEHYSDFGSTTNPKVGIRWSPWKSLKLRASWGTSFRAPELSDLDTSRNASGLMHLPDPQSKTGQSLVLFETGNSPSLHQERASTWAVGLDLAPTSIPGLQASLTYYAIDYRDRIAMPGPQNFDSILFDPIWAEVIQRNPSLATIMAICNGPRFYFGTPADCQNTPPAVLVDIRLRNLSRTLARGVDLDLGQQFENSLGLFRWNVKGAYILTFDQAVTDTAPVVSVANTLTNPIKVRAKAALSWHERGATLAGFSVALAANFVGAYVDNQSTPDRHVASSSTVDAQLGYSTGQGHRWWENAEIALNATNLLNRDPPFVNTELGFDQPNTPPVARLVTLSVKKRW